MKDRRGSPQLPEGARTTTEEPDPSGTAGHADKKSRIFTCAPIIRDTLFLCGRAEPVFNEVPLSTVTNCSDSTFYITSKSIEYYAVYRDSLLGNFEASYRAKCLEAYKYESFTVKHDVSEYHHTLYYYDQAGNLLKTVPPAGVQENYDSAWLDNVAAARDADMQLVPAHGLHTQYRYNTLNQVIAQQTPDAGVSRFWYDRLGRLAISQNARQKNVSGPETGRQYSYTLYDYIGRITEVGQLANAGSSAMSDSISRNESNLLSWVTASAANKEQITQTVYDTSYAGFAGLSFYPVVQRNLRNRVAYTSFTVGSNPLQYNEGTFYTYDIEGNVDTLLQDYGSSSITGAQNIMNLNGNRWKKVVYQYDLVSGKVNSVAYQPHQVDAFYHRYSYDAENRLILSETSQDSVFWDRDARYEYYKHGPLARAVIGDKMVQGLDYAYTLQGWLKGVNSMSLTPLYDMGRDGDTSTQNRYVARDAFGFGLNYYAGDYTPIGSQAAFPGTSGPLDTANYRPLYNGNISSMAVNLGPLYRSQGVTTDNSHWRGPLLYNYKYDQLNRITKMDAFYGLNQATNSWAGLTSTVDLKERVSYDGNGNIQRYTRNNFGETGRAMDSLEYMYLTGTNKLSRIIDSASDAIGGGYDIHNQPGNNYKYDSIGNLIRDSSERLSIQWNVYGKITQIDHDTTTAARPTRRINYYYDAAGNRIGKRVTRGDTATVTYTWYARDASGNVMATYNTSLDSSQALGNADMKIGEKHLYGSSRLGILSAGYSTDANTNGLSIYTSPWTGKELPYYSGAKQYELSNHLGNVLATISDKKIGVSLAADSSLIDHYEADVQTAQDYYPFGMVMPGRMFAKLSIPGGSVSGQGQVNGYTLPVDLTLNSRAGTDPISFVATDYIDLTDGFTSNTNDDVTAYIADASYAGGGNGEGSSVAGSGKYRYGFNGKENDNEVKGFADQIDYGNRIYDPRAARFLTVDGIAFKYPMLSPFQYAGNNPIAGVDIDGKEFLLNDLVNLERNYFGTSHIQKITEGAYERGEKLYGEIKEFIIGKKPFGAIYGEGKTTLTAGIVPGSKPNINPGLELAKQAIKATVKDYGQLIARAIKGDDKAIGALGFEAAMVFLPVGDGVKGLSFGLKELKTLGETIPLAAKTVLNSRGEEVVRYLVRNEDELLKVAEDAAGGSLDKLTQQQGENWWIGDVNGKRTKIEWEPGGHDHLNEGPHVRVQEWIEGGGKKGKGKWNNGDKYFIQGQEQMNPAKKLK